VTGYAIHGDTISCATVTVDARDKFTGIIGKSFPLTSVSMPLWNIAKLYSKTVSGPFILWRIATDGSVLGLMKDGHLDKLLHCYAGADDIRNDPAASKQLIEQFVNSLADGNGEIPVIAYSPEKDFVLPSEPFLSFYKILAMPEIRGVPAFCHEAYANACFNGQDFNFLSHEVQKKAQLADRKMHSLRSLVSISILSVLGLAVLFLGLDGLFTIVDRHYREPMLKLQAETALVKAAERRHGRLAKAVVEKVQFSTQRSHVTQFLSALQNVFPENAWAESIAIALNGKDLYQCDILAATQSSGLIAITLENLSKVAGVSNARLVSSEQGTLRIGGKGMLFKIKCDWRFTE
jgi:Tfp pilus assembly protein PilN